MNHIFSKSKSVPLVLQYEMVECGAASLSMILRTYGKYLPLSELRYQCGVSRDGSNLLNIKKAAIHYGLDAKGAKPSVDEILNGEVSLPCIAWWNYNHFLVFESAANGHVSVADPAGGKYKCSKEQLLSSFSGFVLQFSPTSSFQKFGKPESEIKRFFPELLRYKSAIFYLLLITTALLVTSLATPGLSGAFVQNFLGDQRYELGLPILWISLAVVLLTISLTWIELSIVRKIALSLQRRLSVEIALKILKVDYSFFASRFIGDIAGRLNLSENIGNVLVNQFLVFILGLVGVCLLVPFLLLISWQLTIVSFLYVAVTIFTAFLAISQVADSNRSIQLESGKVSGITVRILSDTKTIKASGLENKYLTTYQDFFTPILRKTQLVQSRMNSFSFINTLLGSVYDYGTTAYSGFLVMNGSMNLAGFMAYQVLRSEITGPLLGISNILNQLQQAEAELGRLQDLRIVENDPKVRSLDQLKAITDSNIVETTDIPDFSENFDKDLLPDSLRLESVSLRFSPLSPYVLSNVSFNLSAGKFISIIGPSGSGKSTLIKILTGLYTESEGKIFYSNRRWLEYSDQAIRTSMAYVSQDVSVFRGTVNDNLTLYNQSYTLEQVRAAASLSCLDETIMGLANGYDTNLGDKGAGLSGGQLQRLEIARAILRKPKILFLDEATSALDIPTEKTILDNIRKLKITTVCVAHRLIAARMSDLVLVLDAGKVSEIGSPNELLSDNNSLFSKLIASEAS